MPVTKYLFVHLWGRGGRFFSVFTSKDVANVPIPPFGPVGCVLCRHYAPAVHAVHMRPFKALQGHSLQCNKLLQTTLMSCNFPQDHCRTSQINDRG